MENKNSDWIKELNEEAKRIHVLHDPEGDILYKVYSVGMAIEVAKIPDQVEQSTMLVFLMMRDANPGLKLEDVKAWPIVQFTRILEKLGKIAGVPPANPEKVN